MRGISISVLLLVLLEVLQSKSALFRGRLRGPNICYHHDTGRYCCPGFTQVHGFCILRWRKPNTPSTADVRAVPGKSIPRLRFAQRPQSFDIISLTTLDRYGRPVGVAYSHGRRESRTSRPVKEQAAKKHTGSIYPDMVDMQAVRRRLAKKREGKIATRPTVRRTATAKPMLKFQSSPKPHRSWDNKNDRMLGSYAQIATGQVGQGYVQAELVRQLSNRQRQVHSRQTYLHDTTEKAEFRRRGLVTRPLSGQKKAIPAEVAATTSLPADDTHNRIYFKPSAIESNRSRGPQQQFQSVTQSTETASDRNTIKFAKCPEGYTSVFSFEEGNLCYPTSALINSQASERAPKRGDAAFNCPEGHSLQSSKYGDACVPYGWQPCSGDPGCSHKQQPIVSPVSVATGCQAVDGASLPCRNTVPSPERCQGTSCADTSCTEPSCGRQAVVGPVNCQGAECRQGQITPNCASSGCSDCTNGGCDDNTPAAACTGPGCSKANDCNGRGCEEEVSAGSGRCFNGGSKMNHGICVCREGFKGSQCEFSVRKRIPPTATADDVDECAKEGTGGRGPCSHKCLNLIGSYKCLCPAGSILAPDGVSCMLITCPKCMHGGHCNTETNQCVCRSGFTGEICEKDIDECSTPGICSHECRNTFGSYACLCRQGYTLLRDGRTCEDWRCKPGCVNGGVCVRNRCICPSGFAGIICQFNNRL